jgi:hypothetical protein
VRWRRPDREPDDWELRSQEFRALRELELDDEGTVRSEGRLRSVAR